jgi:hypothetical protein
VSRPSLCAADCPDTVFMFTGSSYIALCLEGFFYGKISVLCALTCTPAKEVQLFPGLGFYSGIFALYMQRPPNNNSQSRTASIIFYALCLIYVLSTVNVAFDLLIDVLLNVSNNSFCKNIFFFISCAGGCQFIECTSIAK